MYIDVASVKGVIYKRGLKSFGCVLHELNKGYIRICYVKSIDEL